MSAKTISQQLFQALEKIDRPGSFCVSGSVPAVLPGLEVQGLGLIGFPLIAHQAKQIKDHSEQAPYGKGEETVVDTNVRRVWQMTPDRFQLTNPEWQTLLSQLVTTVQEGLGLEKQKLESHLYNMLLYEPGSFFLPHRDGEKLDRMVATLVVMLPSAYKGGELVVRHEGQEQTVDFGSLDNSTFPIHFAAFYADCEHEIRPLREGYRLCLVYNLTLAKAKKAIAAPRSAAHVTTVGNILRDWSAASTEDAPRKLAVTLEHQYTKDGVAWDTLKGVDAAQARVLRDAARQAGCKAYLATLTFHESGSAEYTGGGRRRGRYYDEYGSGDASDYEMDEIFDTSLTADHWMDDEGNRLKLGEMTVEKEEVVPEESLMEVEPEEDFEGYTGNAGMTLDRWYRHAAVFLWPDSRHFQVLCDCGSRKALAALNLLVKKWHKASGTEKAELQAQCVEFAGQIIARWGPGQVYAGYGREAEDLELTPTLVRLGDPNLVRAFLSQVVPTDRSAKMSPALLKVCARHGWATFKDAFAGVFKSTTLGTLERNTQMLEDLCALEARKKGELLDLCRSLAQEALTALETIDQDKTAFDWREREVKRSEVLAGLVRSLILIDQPDQLSRLVAHTLATPKKYPLTPVLVGALVLLGPWLKKNLTKPSAGLSRWLDACREQLQARTAQIPKEPADWRREANISCKCADCAELIQFLKDPGEKVHRFRVRQDRREHLISAIGGHGCDLDHVIDTHGSPHTLVCTKNTASFQRNLKTYHEDKKHLATLDAIQASLQK